MSRLSSLASDLPRQIAGLPCSVAVALAELDAESAADLQAWLEGKRPEYGSDADMWRTLQHLHHTHQLKTRVGRQTVGRHRRYVRGLGGDVCRCAS